MAALTITLTLSGADTMRAMADELICRAKAVGSIAEVERRIGRQINEELIRDLFSIEQIGVDLYGLSQRLNFIALWQS